MIIFFLTWELLENLLGTILDFLKKSVEFLKFLSIEGLYKSMGHEKRNSIYPQFTDHCFTGDYPIKPIDIYDKDFDENQLSFMSSKS